MKAVTFFGQGPDRISGNSLARRRDVLGLLAASATVGVIAGAPASAASMNGLATVATTHAGKVEGYVDTGIHTFKGIRYGADTTARRFMPPAAPTPWAGVQKATAYAASAPQSGVADGQPVSEDCLFLNVWTPALRDNGKRPVMVYIHGGGYSSGSGSNALYDGANQCRRNDVVVVTVNHRLNAFGYTYLAPFLPQLADSGNAGQLDLILALQWVHDNIAEFGGDPGRVLIFGQSGGGAKCATLMAMPKARGLFHRVASMSGQQVLAASHLHAKQRALAFLKALGLTEQTASQIQTLPTAALLKALDTPDPVLQSGGMAWAPVLDERTLTRNPFWPDAPSQSDDIPMIIGNTHDETRYFYGKDPANFALTWEQLPAKLEDARSQLDLEPHTVIAFYRDLYPNYSASDVFFAATTAGRSWRGAVMEAEARARSVPAYVYQLNWASTVEGGKRGAYHTSDIPLVFNNIHQPGAVAEGPTAQAMADIMSDSFAAFARTGSPNIDKLPKWTPYSLPNRQTLIMDVPARMEDDPRGRERAFFGRTPYIQPGS